ncbi:DUF1772 domain-containing protein [Actinokineospora cianjurensis]|uniref:Putative membrane protein n=1 Tax=Actinokineospora cianjurensis TaxID=585224 RepID=A0A421B122_9PSEU|nr:DUF1772 domain-containing protein [Actinokineospora cianjurensis]RLK58028.1 putative membrane protein [Actinokineospora cianjurensis]
MLGEQHQRDVQGGGSAGSLLALWLATTLMALIAGFFYAYSCSVMPGLATVDDETFVIAMRGINAVVRNIAFAPSFFGALVLTALTTALHTRRPLRGLLPWTTAALSFYGAAFVLTLTVNVPLNVQLAEAANAELAAVRSAYEGPWVTWNVIRTALSVLALACLITAVARHGTRRPSSPLC